MAGIRECLEAAMTIDGAVAAALVDTSSGMCLGAKGTHADLELAAAGTAELVRAKAKTIQALKLDDEIEDILTTLGKEYHLIRVVGKDRLLFVYLILRRDVANLALARRKLAEVEKTLEV